MTIEFIDPNQTQGFYLRPNRAQNATKGITGFLVNKGIVKNEAQANYVLLSISIIFLLITVYMIFNMIKKAAIPIQSSAELLEQAKAAQEGFLKPR